MARYTYQKEIFHNGLNKYRVIKGASSYEVNNKAKAQMAQWEEQWERKQLQLQKQEERELIKQNQAESMDLAATLTEEAEEVQNLLSSILLDSLGKTKFNWDELKDFSEFPNPKPKKPKTKDVSPAPTREDIKYNPKIPFLYKLSKSKTEEFKQKNTESFKADFEAWSREKQKNEDQYKQKCLEHEEQLKKWETEKELFLSQQAQDNAKVDDFENNYKSGQPDAVANYHELILNRIAYPFEFDRGIESEYIPETKIYVVDFYLPTKEDIPNLKKVTYIKSREEFKESFHTDSYVNGKYDEVVYQIVLQCLHTIFSADEKSDFIDSVVFNGKISTIDKATGKNIQPYILSIQVKKDSFKELNLASIDPKAWFKSSKGVAAAKIANVTPVAPIANFNKSDSRFVDGYEVTNQLDSSVNLATMDWMDFENLTRELFEQEFNGNGSEVKITQASRDGGVDAVVFDPDPIKGGKIIIQSKRYTNVVGVSAVRDLYGTVMNEGATKGILVTTSNFGSDSYEFAKDKPLTLIDGANLLYLLEKHGHKARIDIKEAKKLMQ